MGNRIGARASRGTALGVCGGMAVAAVLAMTAPTAQAAQVSRERVRREGITVPFFATDLAIADFDGDGSLDLSSPATSQVPAAVRPC